MITKDSKKKDIKDLQRLLIATGMMKFRSSSRNGEWDKQTQKAVRKAYARLGWDHGKKAKWISASALAALAAAVHVHPVRCDVCGSDGRLGGTGSHIGGTGSHIGGTGSHIGGTGSHIGGTGSHIGTRGVE